MAPVTEGRYSDTQRMELRGLIRLASEVIAQYWPMRTFVHHNPLHSLEYLPFEEAVERGLHLLGGKGYLRGDLYRTYVRSGRIHPSHLDRALTPLVRESEVTIGPRRITHGDTLRLCMTHGLCAPVAEPLDSRLDGGPDEPLIDSLADRLVPSVHSRSLGERIADAVREGQAALGRQETLSHWCDTVLGTQIVDTVNGELIEWCEAYLDEGHAAWPMPDREKEFYGTWKSLTQHEVRPAGIADSRRKLARLPEQPEDAVLDSLAALGIPESLRQEYVSLQLAALPGWAGFIKWREEQREYAWQVAHPVDLAQFLAVRLWYVSELVQQACREHLGIDGHYGAVLAFMQNHPQAYFMRRERVAGRLPATYAEDVDHLAQNGRDGWMLLADRFQTEYGPRLDRAARRTTAGRLLALTRALGLSPSILLDSRPEDLKTLGEWMESFPESHHGPVWLRAFEAGYQDRLVGMLMANAKPPDASTSRAAPRSGPARPQSQSVYCIDVRSEPFRRHLESAGAHETYGFAGFFAVFIRFRAWGKEHDTEQFPVIMRARNEVREIPRSYLEHMMSKHESRARLVRAGHTLLHDLKENVVTPYVMVESLGWLYGAPIVGKTAAPGLYRRWTDWLRRLLVPPLSTCVTVDKLSPEETEEMLASEQRAHIWKALRDRRGLHGSKVTQDFVEALRQRALNGEGAVEPALFEAAGRAGLPAGALPGFVDELRRLYRIDRRWAAAQKERITRTGFTLDEQVLTVDTALRMMGLTGNFARLVLFCAHGSVTENNPFESALDCGACGGNEGRPNARVLAAMANREKVRERVRKNGIDIPPDTHFLAGQVDTTTDQVQVFDQEDVPLTHRKDLARLLESLREAGRLTSRERCARLPDIARDLPTKRAVAQAWRRSSDWSQVRPEWGLSGNAAFIIGPRALTRGLDLGGRTFLHSYDHREDPSGRLLEVLLTAPQVVAQWINLEHYFSAVDNEVYGAGSKVYHNVVGRLGVMSGPWSDLRLGLAWQTVMSGEVPYHEPIRMLTVIEAPRPRIDALIARHEMLRHFYCHGWVHLVAREPEEGTWHRYLPSGEWSRIDDTPARTGAA